MIYGLDSSTSDPKGQTISGVAVHSNCSLAPVNYRVKISRQDANDDRYKLRKTGAAVLDRHVLSWGIWSPAYLGQSIDPKSDGQPSGANAKKVDRNGDPLPDGAILRLGTDRLRGVARGAIFAPDGRT